MIAQSNRGASFTQWLVAWISFQISLTCPLDRTAIGTLLAECARTSHSELPLYEKGTVNNQHASALEEQRLLFGGRQLEDGSSLARPRNLAAATRNASMAH